MDPFGNGPDRRCVALRHGKPHFGRRGGGELVHDKSLFARSCLFGKTSYFKIEYLPKVYGFLEETLEGMV